jgi:hypothetical protein
MMALFQFANQQANNVQDPIATNPRSTLVCFIIGGVESKATHNNMATTAKTYNKTMTVLC